MSRLSGTSEYSFTSLWSTVGGKQGISDIKALGPKLRSLQTGFENLMPTASKLNDGLLMEKLRVEINKSRQNYNTWHSLNSKIDTYLPSWLNAERDYNTHPTSMQYTSTNSLGVLPVIIGVAGIAALTTVVLYGMRLLKDYRLQTIVINDVKANLITASTGAKLIEAIDKSSWTKIPNLIKTGIGLVVALTIYSYFGKGVFSKKYKRSF